jgi:DNA-binding winged helix-turn-helix (wHTH) protein/Tol biopolymer transport system component
MIGYEFGSFRFDAVRRLLLRDGAPVSLTPKATDFLLALVEARGRVLTRQDLLDRVWGGAAVEESTLTFHIHSIRQALGDEADHPTYIETVPRRGYRFAMAIRDVSEAESQTTAASAPQEATTVTARIWGRRRVLLTVTVVAAILFAGGGGGLWSFVPQRPLRVVRYVQLSHDGQMRHHGGPLLTDGRFVYMKQSPTQQLAAVPVDGGQTVTVSRPSDRFYFQDVNRDGSQFLALNPTPVRSGLLELWVVPADSGAPQRVADVICSSASWSPDERLIAFTSERELHVVNADGTSRRRLAALDGTPSYPRWSPDGRRLRFTLITFVDRQALQSIWEVGLDGSRLRPLLPGWHEPPSECCGNWTLDGRHFVFQSVRNGLQRELWILGEPRGRFDLRTPEPVQLTSGPLSFDSPVPSPDGARIFAFGVPNHGELVRYDVDLREFVPYLGGISVWWLSFSRDGEWVSYTTVPERHVWISRVDGSLKRQLTFPPMDADITAVSPDGRWVAFRGSLPGSHKTKIYLVPAAGGTPQPITTEDVEQGAPSWSADGTRLAFGEVPPVFGFAHGEALHIYDIPSRTFSVVSGSKDLWTSRWSPDGRHLSALTIAGQNLRIFDFQTEQWRDTQADHVSSPTWSRDGKYIYYDTEGPPPWMLRRVRVADGRVEDIVDVERYPVAVRWAGLALDDSPIVLRSLGAMEVYALELGR